MKLNYIYGLSDPCNPELVMYVGKTINFKQRPRRHLADAIHGRLTSNSRLREWLLNLHTKGLEPCILELEKIYNDSWQDREKYWIAYWRESNPMLCNLSDGGDGPIGAESRGAMISQALNRPEVKEKQKAAIKVAYANPELKEKAKRIWSDPDRRARQSEILKKACARPEIKFRKSLAAIEVNSRPEVKAKISAASKRWQSLPEAKEKASARAKEVLNRPESRLANKLAIQKKWALRKLECA